MRRLHPRMPNDHQNEANGHHASLQKMPNLRPHFDANSPTERTGAKSVTSKQGDFDITIDDVNLASLALQWEQDPLNINSSYCWQHFCATYLVFALTKFSFGLPPWSTPLRTSNNPLDKPAIQ